MLQERKIKFTDYERASRLLGRLFEVDSDLEQQINIYIQHHGISVFFNNLESFDFSSDIFEKLHSVRLVLFGMGEISTMPEETLKDINKPVSEAWKGGKEIW